jgi:hypothetical protein
LGFVVADVLPVCDIAVSVGAICQNPIKYRNLSRAVHFLRTKTSLRNSARSSDARDHGRGGGLGDDIQRRAKDPPAVLLLRIRSQQITTLKTDPYGSPDGVRCVCCLRIIHDGSDP